MSETQDILRVRVTAADFNGQTWDGSPFDPAPAPIWLQEAIRKYLITPSEKHATDYAVWDVEGAGEAWPGDHIVLKADGMFAVVKAGSPQTDDGVNK